MKIYFAIKYHEDNKNRELIESISDILDQYGHNSICIAKDIEKWGENSYDPRELMQISFTVIDKADLVLIEFSEKGVGLGIEAGYAKATNKPIIVICKSGSDVSDTLKGIAKEILFYEKLSDLKPALKRLIIS